MRKELFRLPNGKTTTSVEKYCIEWEAISSPLAKILDCRVIGCDPGIHLTENGCGSGFVLSVTVAQKILALSNKQ